MFKKRIQEYIDTVCHDGIYVHGIYVSNPIDEDAILNAYRVRIYPCVLLHISDAKDIQLFQPMEIIIRRLMGEQP